MLVSKVFFLIIIWMKTTIFHCQKFSIPLKAKYNLHNDSHCFKHHWGKKSPAYIIVRLKWSYDWGVFFFFAYFRLMASVFNKIMTAVKFPLWLQPGFFKHKFSLVINKGYPSCADCNTIICGGNIFFSLQRFCYSL